MRLTDDDLRVVWRALEHEAALLGYGQQWDETNKPGWPRRLKNVRRVLNKVERERRVRARIEASSYIRAS